MPKFRFPGSKESFRPVLIGLLLFSLGCTGLAWSSDLDEYRRLDPVELRAAEARMSDYLEPGTARLLRAPENAAERYVVRRQQRLAADLQARPAPQRLASGEQVQALFWPLARASRARLGEDGRYRVECVSAAALLGRALPDFRQGNPDRRPER